jgi:hypothetical protein
MSKEDDREDEEDKVRDTDGGGIYTYKSEQIMTAGMKRPRNLVFALQPRIMRRCEAVREIIFLSAFR